MTAGRPSPSVLEATDFAGPQPPPGALVGDLQPGAGKDGRNVFAGAPAVFAGRVQGHVLLAAVERQDRFGPHIGALLDALQPGHGRMLADPRQFRRNRPDRFMRHRRSGGEPGRHPGRQRRFGDTGLPGCGIEEER